MNVFARYAALKKKVGGNYEKPQFEYAIGPTVAEQNRISEMPVSIRRILAQLLFALQLSKRLNGRFDAEVEAALSLLEKTMEEESVLTKSACMAAEQLLLPLKDEAKAYTVLYASHAHIDMNWMWGWQETVAVTLSTFRTILNLMNEYPDFTYSQSQASVYKIVEEYDPDMMPEIQKRIREGRWEITANAWVETDKNMPDTESLLRHIRTTRDYLHEVWGISPDAVKVDFSPDTFGHSRFIPEINTFGNVPYYYHCRGLQDDLVLYRYRAPSGNEVLMYKEPFWYNSSTSPDNGTGIFEVERRCAGLKTGLIVYGVGNHGGGPTRRDIETILEMQKWPVFPTMRFGTLHEFFRAAESVRDSLPVIDHEVNAIFTGCYSTQSRIKLANRRAEAALVDSERISALSHAVLGTAYAAKRYEKAWQNVLFTHFHDILTGSCVQESREYAMGKLAESIGYAQTEQSKAFEKLSQAADTSMFPADDCICRSLSEGAGVGYGISNYAGVPNPERGAGKTRIYTVFNTSPVHRRETAELTAWDYAGDLSHIEVVDHENKPVQFQVLDAKPQHYWDHKFTRVLIEADVPPMGYAVYAVKEAEITDYPTHLQKADRLELPQGPIVLENNKICARFDTGTGLLHSLINKETGEEMLSAPAGLHLVRTEDAGMSAWRIGRYMGMTPVTETNRVNFFTGKLRSGVIFEQNVMHSTVKVTVTLDDNADTLHYHFEVDWHESRNKQEYVPLLTYRLPLKKGAGSVLCDVPAGAVSRPSMHMDVPALSMACAETEGVTPALICDCKYGFRLADNVLSVTLINTAGNPDPYPERGIHNINLYVALTTASPAALKRKSETLIRPMTCVPTASHPGALPPKHTLLSFSAEHTLLTAVQVSVDDALSVRMYEAEGKEETVTLCVPFEPTRALLVDLNEQVLGEACVSGSTVSFSVEPYRIAQVKLYR